MKAEGTDERPLGIHEESTNQMNSHESIIDVAIPDSHQPKRTALVASTLPLPSPSTSSSLLSPPYLLREKSVCTNDDIISIRVRGKMSRGHFIYLKHNDSSEGHTKARSKRKGGWTKGDKVRKRPRCRRFVAFFSFRSSFLYFNLHAHIHLLSSCLATALLLGLGSFGGIAVAAAVAPSFDLSL